MTLQDLDAAFRARVAKDKKLAEIRRKIAAGKATFRDTAAYSERISNLLGETLSGHIEQIPASERAKVCEWLLRNQYADTNETLAAVQRVLDEADGIRLAPQKPAFPVERVNKVSGALEDVTAAMDVIRRRANAPVANVSKSFHDDYIKRNAEFRSKAGLPCYIVREAASGCCKWCTDIAGRYECNGDLPEDVYRRHDNCSCTTTYENGRMRQDVWSKRQWEAPEPDAGAEPPTFFTEENRPAGFQLSVPAERGISGKSQSRTEENTVNIEMLHTEAYKQKFTGITGNPSVDQQIYTQAVAQLTHRNGTYKEDLALISSITGKVEGRQSKSSADNVVNYNSSLTNAIAKNPAYSLISIHNHGTNNPPTGSDLAANGGRKYKLGVVVTHNGRVFTYKAGSKPFLATSFDARVDKLRGQGYNEFDAIIEALNQYTQEYGIEWSER